MSDPRRRHEADPRPQHGESRQAQQDVLSSPISVQAFAQFLMQRRRQCYQEAAEIERLLGVDSAEMKLRKQVKDLERQLHEMRRSNP